MATLIVDMKGTINRGLLIQNYDRHHSPITGCSRGSAGTSLMTGGICLSLQDRQDSPPMQSMYFTEVST